MITDRYKQAADAVVSATALVIGAGAGMGIDSGLPDFRGPEGFWKAYPPFRGKKFHEISTPHWFATDPQLAWGFFGHRWHMYRSAIPHDGFHILRNWAEKIASFVFTSNVDGQFQKAGFPESQIYECHGSVHYLQCASPCGNALWSSSELNLEINPETIRTSSALPQCPRCRRLARPNVLMFCDFNWVDDRAAEQSRRWEHWLKTVDRTRMVTIEIGAGLAIPSVRMECESLPGTMIRINPRDPDVPPHGISLPVGALEALRGINEHMLDGLR